MGINLPFKGTTNQPFKKERLNVLWHVMQIQDDRLPKIFLFGQSSRAKQKLCRLRLIWDDALTKDQREIGSLLDGAKREALNGLVWKRSIRCCVCLK